MKKVLIIGLMLLAIAFISNCKKDNITTGGGATYTIASNGDISGTFNGVLFEEYSTSPSTSSAEAIFYNSPTAFHESYVISGHLTSPTGTVTAVYVNNVKFSFISVGGMDYKDSTYTLTFPPANWQINGGSIIPSFSYTCNTPIPSYTTMSNLPTAINRSQNLSIYMGGNSGYDQVEIDIDDNVGHTASMLASNSASYVTFPKDSLTKLVAGNGTISVGLVKYNPQVLASKDFLFVTSSSYSKSGITLQ